MIRKKKQPRSRNTLNRRTRRPQLEGLETRKLLAADLQVLIENLSPEGGLGQTPFWVAFHDGSFDLANEGESAAGFGGLELLAEEGMTSELETRFDASGAGVDAVIAAPDGFPNAPVFEPSEIVNQDIRIEDTQANRYFSYASMIIPSNDAFVANLDPQALEIFGADGTFLGPRTIVIYGSQVWDAGTEVNDPFGGAAYSTEGGTSVDENGVVHRHMGLDEFIGTGLPTGSNLESAFTDQTPLARITLSLTANPSAPLDNAAPLASLASANVNARSDFHEITVTYSDASGVDPTSISVEDIRVTTPFLTTLDVLSVTTDAAPGTTPRTVTAVYRVAPSSGEFTAADNGTYSVALVANEVGDTFAQLASGQLLGQFDVDVPVRLQVTIENLSSTDGLGQTPFWIAAHDGNFEIARAGVAAANFGGLEALAEEGTLDELVARFAAESAGNDTTIASPDGAAPVFEPGETVTSFLDVSDPQLARYFSYASMIIPSNDAFIANLDPRQIELFDQLGNFTGSRSFTIYGHDVWDAGTEVNDPANGAAFTVAGGPGVGGADENGVVTRHAGLDDFIGTALPPGNTLAKAFGINTPLARVTISLADIPADPIDSRGPQVTAEVNDITAAGTTTQTIEVTYSDPSGIDITSIDVSDLQVVGAFTAPLEVTSVTTDAVPGTTPAEVTAVYEVTTVDGEFTTFQNGVYHVNTVEGAVTDTLGNGVGESNLADFTSLVGVRLQITVENLSPDGGLAQTPFWIGLHEGNFELARLGASASEFAGIEELAELGDASVLDAAFSSASDGLATVIAAPDGFAGAPVFEPGESASQVVELFNTNVNRYFSFASMLIPSNDAFFANLNPRAYELFDINGVFQGQQTITLFGSDIWDAGTEVNDPTNGAAFTVAGGAGVGGADENGVITRHAGLDNFIGTDIPTGTLQSAFAPNTPLARITISLAGTTSSPIDDSGPTALLEPTSAVTTAGTTGHEIQVTYDDPAGLDLTRFGNDDLTVLGPLGQQLQIIDTVVNAPEGTSPRSATVTYTLATESGEFTAINNGRYAVSVNENAVGDTFAQGSQEQAIGDLNVNVGVRLQIQIESLSPDGGLGQTPFWLGFHDGAFEVGRAGVAASEFGGLEELAEDGITDGIVARFAAESTGVDTVVTSPEGFAVPVFEPGETVTQVIEVTDPNVNQYFSYASMIIPSNDAFVANLDPRAFELFDSNGNFQGARSFTITGDRVWDAGTEVNSPTGDAAFSTGGGTAVDEGSVIRLHEGLDDFIGTGLPTNETLAVAFGDNLPLARITVTLLDPEASACSGEIGACSVSSVGLHNPQSTLDVNADGVVEPLDALLIINFLNRFGTTSTIDDEARSLGLFLDVSQNDSITPIDALLIVNRLNRIATGTGNAEAESTDAALAGFTFEDFGNGDEEEELLDALASGIAS